LGEIHEQENEEPAEARLAERIPPGDIHIENLSFRYTPIAGWVLEDVNLVIPRGKITAIVGMSGSGKTTLVKLLLGFYKPERGKIKIGPADLQQIRPKRWREQCGVVLQDGYIFSDTIANNIAFGRRDADREDIEQYARHAAVYDDIMGLSEGFEAMVGERGVTLSGGQKQRVSIARALIKNPDLIILDDSLSAVDTNTEKQITGYFNTVLADKTAIIVTHRIYSSLEFDKIIVLQDGKIAEEGTHEELLLNKAYYADMYERQSLEETE